MQEQSVRFLGLNGGPGLALLGNHEMHELLVVPEELPLRLRGPQHLAELFQKLHAPNHALARRKALSQKVPFLAERLPGRNILRADSRLLDEFRKADDRFFQE